jgi:hypothetical protein
MTEKTVIVLSRDSLALFEQLRKAGRSMVVVRQELKALDIKELREKGLLAVSGNYVSDIVHLDLTDLGLKCEVEALPRHET